MYLALSKRKFDILRRSLAEVVHMHNVVRQKFAFLHAFRVVSDMAVLCLRLWHRVKKIAKRRGKPGSSGPHAWRRSNQVL